VIFASTTPVTAALQRETRTIPIVFVIRLAPASWQALRGQVETSRGSPTVEAALGGKWLQMLKEIAPRVKRVAIMFNPDTAPGGGASWDRSKPLPDRWQRSWCRSPSLCGSHRTLPP
jgi:putative tryptophan/tyrosine transport system substrate-binding protein